MLSDYRMYEWGIINEFPVYTPSLITVGGGFKAQVVTKAIDTVTTATIASGGTGYAVDDVLKVPGGTGIIAFFNVDAVSGGVVTAVSLLSGSGVYLTSAKPTNPAATTTKEAGTSCTLTISYTSSPIGTSVDFGVSVFFMEKFYAYQALFNQLHEGEEGILPQLTTTERDNLKTVRDGRRIMNITEDREDICSKGGIWSSVAGVGGGGSTYKWPYDGYCSFSVSTKIFLPLTGSTSEGSGGSTVRMAIPGAGKLLKLRFKSNVDLGSTIVTLEDNGASGEIGSKTVDIGSSGVIEIDFTTGVAGTNEFVDADKIIIGLDPTNTGGQLNYYLLFEINN